MKLWTISSPTHENGLQIAHFCDWCGSFVLKISRNSRHESLDEIIAHPWKWSPDSSLLWLMWLFCTIDLKKLATLNFGRNHRPLMKMVSRQLTSVIDVALLFYRSQKTFVMKVWTKSSFTHENGLQIAHFCDWCGSFVLEISRNSHEKLDKIKAQSWEWSPDSSILWLMWLFCTLDLKKLSTWKIGRKQGPIIKFISRYLNSAIVVALLYYRSQETLDMKIWTKSTPTHENDLQIAHFCDWCGCFVLWILRNSRHENLDKINAHSWKWSPDSSLLWLIGSLLF